MDVSTQKLVRNRAGNRCEYCHLHQDAAPFLRFHIEHVQARQHINAFYSMKSVAEDKTLGAILKKLRGLSQGRNQKSLTADGR